VDFPCLLYRNVLASKSQTQLYPSITHLHASVKKTCRRTEASNNKEIKDTEKNRLGILFLSDKLISKGNRYEQTTKRKTR